MHPGYLCRTTPDIHAELPPGCVAAIAGDVKPALSPAKMPPTLRYRLGTPAVIQIIVVVVGVGEWASGYHSCSWC